MNARSSPDEKPSRTVRDARPGRRAVVARPVPMVAALAAAALLAGCASGGPPAASASASSHTIMVTDQRGTTLTFARPVERIVTIPMPAASMVVAIDGGTEHLVGMNPTSAKALTDGVLGEFYPDATAIASNVSGTDFVPNVESILSLHPDVVIQWGDQGDKLTAPLERAGIPVIGLKYGTQDDLEEWARIFGTILGKNDRASRLIDSYHQGVTDLRSRVADAQDKPGILYLNQSSTGYKAAGTDTYNDFCINLVGGRNVAAELKGTTGTSVEQILAWNPDIILLGNFDRTMPADMYANTLLQDVAAVKNRRVYRVPLGGYRWDPPSQESVLMWRWLAQVAHPGLTLDPIRPQITSSYNTLYGVTPTDAQLDRILQKDNNAGSANYGVFSG